MAYQAGDRIGTLVCEYPTHRVLSSGRRMPAWVVRCDCGNEVIALTANLQKGKYKSCGCQRVANIGKTRASSNHWRGRHEDR